MISKPTPEQLEQLRDANPQGAPHFSYREMELVVERAKDRAAGDELESIPVAISSERAVLRYDWWRDEYFYEVLDHAEKSIDLSYSGDGLPFIAGHRAWDADSQHGIVENVRVEKKVLRGDIRMSRAARSQEIKQDLFDGIRKKVSVGYILGDDYEETKSKDDEYPTRRYRSWMPIEVSTVPVPADYDVGVGRSKSAAGQAVLARFLQLHPANAGQRSSQLISPPSRGQDRNMAENVSAPVGGGSTNTASDPTEVAIAQVRESRDREDKERITRVLELGRQHGVMERVEGWLRERTPITDVVTQINGVLEERLKKPIQQAKPIALSKKDNARFSFARMMLMQDDRLENFMNTDPEFAGKRGKMDYGLEQEVFTEAVRRSPIPDGARKGGVFIPFVAQDDGRDLTMGERLRELHERDVYYLGRGIDSATSTTGGPFKFTQPGDFIALLRNKTSVLRAGVTVLSGLSGPVTFPKQSGPGSASWRAENPGSDISRVDLATTTVTLSFKTIQAAMAVSRQALFSAASGNYDLEGIVRADLAAIIGLAIDLAGLNGLGASNQPLGLLQDTSVGTAPALGTNGGSIAWGNLVDLETAIGDANADVGTMSYLTNTKQRGQAKKVAVLGNTASGVPLWTGTPGIMDGVANGYRAIASNQVPRNLTKGTATTVCSAWVFGVFEHLLMGVFGGGFEMMTDPYTLKLQNMVDVTAWSFIDFANRYPAAFATIKDAL